MEINEVNQQGDNVQVLFRKETPYGDYQDALYFTQAEYAALTPEAIEAMKQARIDNWISIVTTPPVPTDEVPPPPPEA